ncbi:MAG TPA: fumarylacetoacetate hydrolase family protein [Stellaceae bacterium]
MTQADSRRHDEWHRAAQALAAAERDCRPTILLSAAFPHFTVADAYQVQLINIRDAVAAGNTVRGYKVGLTNKAVQQQSGIDEPDYGHLLADRFLVDGESVPIARLLMPGVEIELAFVMATPLRGPGVTATDVLRATAFAVPAIEIVGSRYDRTGPNKFTIVDTIADNAGFSRIVLGGQATPVAGIELSRVGGILRKNAEIVDTGALGAVLGNPANSVAWLANKLADFDIGFAAGDVVLAGSCVKILRDLRAGDVIAGEFDRFGQVTVRFG